ncbi:MAG: energy-coupled thiamine transporter ThiT [Clostridia bacterium]|nr:energy-coupled thiamine transporter ThiT [Clostridia bacterium]
MKKTRQITEIAMAVALAVVCSFIKVWEMPQGGSIALTMIPVLLISFRCGALSGIVAGALYGTISAMLSGVIYHPMSILLDYVLAFGLLGVAGFFKKNTPGIILGSCLGVFGRFLSSLISGAVLFASYAPEGQNPWIYSLIYQSTYMIPELIICVCVLLLIYSKAKNFFIGNIK